MLYLNPVKKPDLLRKCESKKVFHVGITAGLHEILHTNYCGSHVSSERSYERK